MRILVDMDGVLADFDAGFLARWRSRYPERTFIPTSERTSFYAAEQYPPEWKNDVWEITLRPGFFRDLPPIPGGRQALEAMRELDWQVYLCSSPIGRNPHCLMEKQQWVMEHLGPDWTRRLILTKDKTLVLGDILIDDRPAVTGVVDPPPWEHVLYDQPYNREVRDRRRLDWGCWRGVL